MIKLLGCISCICGVCCIPVANSLQLSDFIPGYLSPTKESYESGNVKVKPLVESKRNSSTTKSWYCNRNHDSANNVFCDRTDNEVVHSLSYDESSISGDRTKIVDNAVTDYSNSSAYGNNNFYMNQNNYVNPNTSSNQNTMLDKGVKNTLQKSQGGLYVPIQPGKDVNMNVNQQQIQFNIKY
ncbi:MAG: hypothetical protein QG673_1131 [Pseudomonadota bacterium]|nr:hypothetical protein [Pseudomonadota bacterium]